MKIWREYSEKLNEYYSWVPYSLERKWKASLISFNATGINPNKEEFFDYCLKQIQKEMVFNNSMYIYIVVLERVTNPSSKVERYKKCWKKISDSSAIDYLELGKEIEYRADDNLYYISIARTRVQNLNKVLRLVDLKKKYRYLFISQNDYFEEIEKKNIGLDDFVQLNCYDEIDYQQVIEKRIFNHDLACCYGNDSIGIELALIFKNDDKNKYIVEQ